MDHPLPLTAATRRAGHGLSGLAGLGLALVTALSGAQAQSLDGDTGLAVMQASSPVRGVKTTVSAIPFVYADLGRWFARIDTVGLRTLELGKGSLEIVARLGQDGWRIDDDPALAGLAERKPAALVGLGTFQRTELGAYFAHVYHDMGRSKGTVLTLNAVARFELGRLVGYPSLGLDWRDARYNRHFHGLSTAEAAAYPGGGGAYQPSDAVVPKLGLLLDLPLTGPWHLLASGSVQALPGELTRSPLVRRSTQHTLLLAGVYRWK